MSRKFCGEIFADDLIRQRFMNSPAPSPPGLKIGRAPGHIPVGPSGKVILDKGERAEL
jgi:hypothetical protein